MKKKRSTSPRHKKAVFISYSHKDKAAADRISERLAKDGHEVLIDSGLLRPGDNISEKINTALTKAGAVIFVVSRNSLYSDAVQREFSVIALRQVSVRQQRIIPVRLDECELPSYLSDRLYIDFAKDFEHGLHSLSLALAEATPQPVPPQGDSRESHCAALRDCLRKGRLTLFCGAGVSIEAGVPSWNSLLATLLDSMLDILSKNKSLDLGSKAAEEFQRRHAASSLILGKYLKNNLGDDFAQQVRESLYAKNPRSCALIDGVVALARPQRDSRPLDSIVTFNFDGLLEENLLSQSIPNRAIFSESIGHSSNELPVYHVHGYLPRQGRIDDESDLVFSEDAYHTQFIDAFSWSNLIQLNKLTQNTCLMLGISLTDPNMRRLLDVAWRKNPEKRRGHFIVKKAPPEESGDLGKVTRILEEQDANALGLNVVWVTEYSEVPTLLKEIADG